MEKRAVVGKAYMNTILTEDSFRLISSDGDHNKVCLVDMKTWECLTEPIVVINWRKIRKSEWAKICNGCPQLFYYQEPDDINYDTAIEALSYEEK